MILNNGIPSDVTNAATILANKMMKSQMGDLTIKFQHATLQVMLKPHGDSKKQSEEQSK